MEYLPLIFIIISIAVQVFKKANKRGDGMTEEERFEAMKKRIEEAQRRQKEKELEKQRGYSLPPVPDTPETRPTPMTEPNYQTIPEASCDGKPDHKTNPSYNDKTRVETGSKSSYRLESKGECQEDKESKYESPSRSSHDYDGRPKVAWPSYERDRQDNHGGLAMASKLDKQIDPKSQCKTANAQKDLIVARSNRPLYGNRKFTPLQQGLLWATILDKPLSQQRGRDGYRGVRSRV